MAITPSPLTILQAAFPVVGCNPPTSIDDNTDEAKAAKATYEIDAREFLSRHAWSWATKTALATYKGERTDQRPRYEYTLPADVITVRSAQQGTFPFRDFMMEDGLLLCDLFDAKNIYVSYSRRVSEIHWPPAFVAAMVDKVASRLASGLLDRASEGDAYERRAEKKLLRAKRIDRRQFPGSKVYENTSLQRRWSGSNDQFRTGFYGKNS